MHNIRHTLFNHNTHHRPNSTEKLPPLSLQNSNQDEFKQQLMKRLKTAIVNAHRSQNF